MILLVTVLFTILSAFLYRVGGMSKEEAQEKVPWLPLWFVNTRARDIGCSVLSVSWMWFFYQPVPWWVYLISFGAMWGMLTTYWDFLFGYDNFFMHGAGIAFAFIPFAIVSGGWLGFGIRFISLALTMGIWSKCFDVESIK